MRYNKEKCGRRDRNEQKMLFNGKCKESGMFLSLFRYAVLSDWLRKAGGRAGDNGYSGADTDRRRTDSCAGYPYPGSGDNRGGDSSDRGTYRNTG